MDLFLSCTCSSTKGLLRGLSLSLKLWITGGFQNVDVTLSRDEGRGTPGVVWGEDVYGSMFTTTAYTDLGFKTSKLPYDFWVFFSRDEKCSSKYMYVCIHHTDEQMDTHVQRDRKTSLYTLYVSFKIYCHYVYQLYDKPVLQQ